MTTNKGAAPGEMAAATVSVVLSAAACMAFTVELTAGEGITFSRTERFP